MLFLLSLIFYNYVFLPTLRFFIVKIFGEFNSDINSVWSTIESILYFLFQSVWIVPFFAVSKIINNLYFQVSISPFNLSLFSNLCFLNRT
jgi:hypothetical protein